jgi:hypothetical protein
LNCVAIQFVDRATREMRTSSRSPSSGPLQGWPCGWSPWPIQTLSPPTVGETGPLFARHPSLRPSTKTPIWLPS